MPEQPRPVTRATSSVVGVVLLVALTIAGVAAVSAAFPDAPAEPAPVVDFRLAADATEDSITITHVAGDDLDVADLRLDVSVDGEALVHQPPVPFFAARGYVSGPTGPLNHAGGTTWRAGQSGTLRIATTNAPRPDPGDRVSVTVAADRAVVADLDATAT